MRINFRYQWKSKQLRLLFIATISIWAILAIILAFFDLQISVALVDNNSQWAKDVAAYGEIPGYILISISITLILRELWTRPRWIVDPVFLITYFINILVIVLLLGDLVPESFLEDSGEVVLVLGYLLGQLLIIQLTRTHEFLSKQKCMNFSHVTFYLGLLIPLVFVQSIKQLWGRVRFRDLSVNYTDFTPWFHPQGLTGNYSFPSGHTAMGWMLLPILILLTNKNSMHYRIIGGVVIVWGVIVALGRIVIGAHYASDVVFSTGAAFVTFILLFNKFNVETQTKDL